MYDERKDKFSFKSFFLTLLLVLLFIFLMLWLFPTKNDLNNLNLQSTYDLERLSILYDEIFANNVARMKDAAIGYFTNERMPQKIGETKKLTLKEMYELHLVLKMKDINGNLCDENKSYVEMTKYDQEYRLKVNLSCGNQEDYIIVYLGCYDYCDGICEKRVETSGKVEEEPTTPEKKPEKKPDPEPEKKPDPEPEKKPDPEPEKKPDPEPEPKPDPEPEPKPEKQYMYEYKLIIKDTTECTNWTEWSKNKVEATKNIKVETKTKNEIISYTTTKVQTGTKKETVVVGQKHEKFIADYLTKLVVVGTKKVQVGTTTKTITEKVEAGTVEVYAGIGSGSAVPKNTSKVKYKVISTDKSSSCSYCNDETIYTWEIWNVEIVYDVVTRTEEVPVYKTINIYEEQTIPVYDYKVVDITEEKVTPIYKDVKEPVYGDVTYYRQKTCTVKKGSTSIKWSKSNSDTDLLSKGYRLTGNVKEV